MTSKQRTKLFALLFWCASLIAAQDGLTGKEPLDPKGPDCIDKEQFEILKNSGQEIIGDECVEDVLPKEAFVQEYYSSLPAFGSSFGMLQNLCLNI